MHIRDHFNDEPDSIDLHFSHEKLKLSNNPVEHVRIHENIIFHQELQRALEQLDLSCSIHSNFNDIIKVSNERIGNMEELVRISNKFEEIKTSINNDNQVFEVVNTSLHNTNKPIVEIIKTPVKIIAKPIPIMTEEKLRKLSEITEILKSVNTQLDLIFEKSEKENCTLPSYSNPASKYFSSSRYDYSPATTVEEFYPQSSLLNNEFMNDVYSKERTEFYKPQITSNSRPPVEYVPIISHKAPTAKKSNSKKRRASRSKSKNKTDDVQINKINKENSHMNMQTASSHINSVQFEGNSNLLILKTFGRRSTWILRKLQSTMNQNNPALQYLINQKKSLEETELDLSYKNEEELDLSALHADIYHDEKEPQNNEEEELNLSGRIAIDNNAQSKTLNKFETKYNISKIDNGQRLFSFLKYAKIASEEEVTKLQKQFQNSIY